MLFLAGGIAFNLILAALPVRSCCLRPASRHLLPIVVRHRRRRRRHRPSSSSSTALLPAHNRGSTSALDKVITDLLRTRGSITIYSAIGFIWFSTRLFGSLRTVLASVFDIESERGIIAGKIFDVKITVLSHAAVRRQRHGAARM